MAYFGNTQRPRTRRRKRLRNFNNPLNNNTGKNILIGIIFFVLFSFLLLGLFSLFSSDYFRLKSIDPIGERTASKDEIKETLAGFKGRIVFFVNKAQIQSTLSEKYPGMKVVRVQKYWPDNLQVIVTETEPLIYFVNLSGVYVVNEDGSVTEIVHQEEINFAENQINIITGADGINSKLVRDRLASEFKESNKNEDEKFVFSKVSDEKKLETLTIIQQELIEQSLGIMRSYTKNYQSAQSPDLEVVYAFENTLLNIGDEVDKNKLQLTREVVKFFNQSETENIKDIFWEGKFLVKVETDTGKTIVFGTNRPISDQLEDLEIVTSELEKENSAFTEIDLTSRKISVK